MLPKSEQHQQAHHLFFQTDLKQTEIAGQLGVSERTVSRWVNDGQWKQLKAAARFMPAKIVDSFQAQLAKLQTTIMAREDSLPTMEEVNIMSRLVLCISRMKVQVTKASNVEVLQNFIGFVDAVDHQLAEQTTLVAQHYLKGKAFNGLFPYELAYDSEGGTHSECSEESPENLQPADSTPSTQSTPGNNRTTPSLITNDLNPKPDNEKPGDHLSSVVTSIPSTPSTSSANFSESLSAVADLRQPNSTHSPKRSRSRDGKRLPLEDTPAELLARQKQLEQTLKEMRQASIFNNKRNNRW
jgi:hypothetical protein